MNKIQYKSR